MSYGRDLGNPQDIDLVRRVKKDLAREGFTCVEAIEDCCAMDENPYFIALK